LEFLDAEPWLVEYIERQRQRAAADMRRLGRLIDEGLLARVAANLKLPEAALATPAHIRAAAVAYLADFRGVRRLLSASEIIDEVYQRAALESPQSPTAGSKAALGRLFRRYWKQHARPEYHRAACWWATLQNFWGVVDALRVWHCRGVQARADGEKILTEILRHPGRITEQLVTMRTVQTLAILDILNYRQHIYELGEYARYGDPHDALIRWHTECEASPA
jgi:hypothetical protein